jgi:voltage-gated potassium channel
MSTAVDVIDPKVERFQRFVGATDFPLALLALLIVPALVLEDHAQSLQLRELAIGINWFVWLAFCAEYGIKLALAPNRRLHVTKSWFDLLIIILSPPFLVPQALQSARAVRAIRILRLLRFVRATAVAAMGLRLASDALKHRRFHYVLLATIVIVSLGAVGIFVVERGSSNSNIHSMGDAFWWAIVTATTVGYGDLSPVTGEGRVIAVGLMIVGIGFIGILTATLTSFFFDQERSAEAMALERRLDRIEDKLDALVQQRKEIR